VCACTEFLCFFVFFVFFLYNNVSNILWQWVASIWWVYALLATLLHYQLMFSYCVCFVMENKLSLFLFAPSCHDAVGSRTRKGEKERKRMKKEKYLLGRWFVNIQVTCYSTWLSDQILNAGHWCVGEVVYLDEICRTTNMTAETMHTLLEFMYTGRT